MDSFSPSRSGCSCLLARAAGGGGQEYGEGKGSEGACPLVCTPLHLGLAGSVGHRLHRKQPWGETQTRHRAAGQRGIKQRVLGIKGAARANGVWPAGHSFLPLLAILFLWKSLSLSLNKPVRAGTEKVKKPVAWSWWSAGERKCGEPFILPSSFLSWLPL